MYYIISIIVVLAIIAFCLEKVNRRTTGCTEDKPTDEPKPIESPAKKAEAPKPVNEMKPVKAPRKAKKTAKE